jgi:hypothetical protein
MEPVSSGLQLLRDHVSGFLIIRVDPSLINRIFCHVTAGSAGTV